MESFVSIITNAGGNSFNSHKLLLIALLRFILLLTILNITLPYLILRYLLHMGIKFPGNYED